RFLAKDCLCNFFPFGPEIVATFQCSILETPIVRTGHAAEHEVASIYGLLEFRRLAVNEFGPALDGNWKQKVADRVHTAADPVAGLEDGDVFSGVYKAPGCGETCNARADDDYRTHADLDYLKSKTGLLPRNSRISQIESRLIREIRG